MANKMADKKKNTSRSQVAATKTPLPEKEQPVRSARAVSSEDRKEQPKKEQAKRDTKAVRRGTKSTPTFLTRVRSNRIGRFLLDAYYELRYKVTWPTFEEARNMTIVVILLSVAIGAILAAADFGLYHLFSWISGVGK